MVLVLDTLPVAEVAVSERNKNGRAWSAAMTVTQARGGGQNTKDGSHTRWNDAHLTRRDTSTKETTALRAWRKSAEYLADNIRTKAEELTRGKFLGQYPSSPR